MVLIRVYVSQSVGPSVRPSTVRQNFVYIAGVRRVHFVV